MKPDIGTTEHKLCKSNTFNVIYSLVLLLLLNIPVYILLGQYQISLSWSLQQIPLQQPDLHKSKQNKNGHMQCGFLPLVCFCKEENSSYQG